MCNFGDIQLLSLHKDPLISFDLRLCSKYCLSPPQADVRKDIQCFTRDGHFWKGEARYKIRLTEKSTFTGSLTRLGKS